MTCLRYCLTRKLSDAHCNCITLAALPILCRHSLLQHVKSYICTFSRYCMQQSKACQPESICCPVISRNSITDHMHHHMQLLVQATLAFSGWIAAVARLKAVQHTHGTCKTVQSQKQWFVCIAYSSCSYFMLTQIVTNMFRCRKTSFCISSSLKALHASMMTFIKIRLECGNRSKGN